jgi:Subtilisin inhibitor-like
VRYQRSLLAAVAGLALLGTFAPAQPAQASLYPPTALVLSVGYGEDTDSVRRAVTLRCNPDGGDHPDVASACTALNQVDGDFIALAGEDGVCTREYRPVTVTANGVWRGQHTHYRATYSNRCMLIRGKGTVFEF